MHSFGSLYPTPSLFFFLLTYLFALFPRSERLEQARILKKRLPSTGWFNFWKESEIARAKSGEYSGCSINRMPLSSRYVCVLRAMWGAALSWCNWIRDRRRVRAVDWLSRRTFGNTEVVYYVAVIVALSGIMSTTTGPWVLKKMVNILFLERKPVFRTSGRGSSSASHTILERLSFIMKKEIQHSSPVTTSQHHKTS